MPEFLRSIDTVVMGRETYNIGIKLGGSLHPRKKNIILSSTLPADSVKGASIESGNPADLALKWTAKKGKNIWLMGGAAVFGSFLDAGALDELILNVVPVAIGTGIPLFDPKPRTSEMKLLSVRKFTDGVVRLHYAVGVVEEEAVEAPVKKAKKKSA
jgi:dihydrofolate reductase